jgi:transcriptional regulator with XRE-family HTH domain
VSSGQLIRQARLRAGLSQQELGERVGLPGAQIGRWERDVVAPSFETLRVLLRACGFDLPARLERYDTTLDQELRANLRLTPQERIQRALKAPPHPRRGTASRR